MAREMKDSGIEWIGEIPLEWETIRGKALFRQRNEKGNNICLQLLSPTQKYGVIPQSLYESLSGLKAVKLDENADYTQLKTIHKGDFCISLRSFQGGFEYSEYEGVVSPAYQVFYSFGEICNQYYRYLFKDRTFIDKMNSYTLSLRDGKNIAFSDFANTYIPFPPIQEQKKIAALLDDECVRIDAVMEQTRVSIEEYKKLKQAVITQAVTKGIRPNRTLKDSGNQWIGSIPQEWDNVISRFVIDQIGDVDHYMPASVDNGIPYVMTGDLKEQISKIVFCNCKQISNEDYLALSKKVKPEMGDVIFARYATIGTVCYVDVDIDCIISYSCVVIKPIRSILCGKYLYYYLKSQSFLEDVKQYTNSNTQGNVGIEALYRVKIPIPGLEEQNEIAKYLDAKSKKIDILIEKKERFLEDLGAYKKTLIYEYVTGKKEVAI